VLGLALLATPVAPGMAQGPPPQELTVNFLTQGEPDTLDPNRASFAYAVDGAVVRPVFVPLLRFDQNLIPQPAAAESYDVSLDGTTYTFHLRADGRWSDGQPVTAGDFAYSWKRLLDPALHAEYTPVFANAGIVGVKAVDDLTLQVQLSQPSGALPDLAALWIAAPLRPDIVDANPDDWATDPSTYIGNGPFMVSEWAHQDHLTLVPNPQYVTHLGWPTPTLSRVTILMQTNPEADYAAYTAGSGRDWILVPDVDANQVLNDAPLVPQTRRYNELTTFWLELNTAHAPLNNVLVRRALSKAVDRVGLVRDPFIGMGLVLNLMAETGRKLSELADALPAYHIVKDKYTVSRERLPELFRALPGRFPQAKANDLDGLRLDWPDRWVHVRPSNTEPIVRVIAEAPRAEDARALCREVGALLAS